MEEVPYRGLQGCGFARRAELDSAASENRILGFQKLPMDTKTLKLYVSQRWPVVVAVRADESFKRWSGDNVYTGAGYGGQTFGHALVVTGYDDAKGANGAFRLQNSWGQGWADGGSIWIDQAFLTDPKFYMAAFVSKRKQSDPDIDRDGTTDPEVMGSGRNIQIWPVSEGPDPTPHPGGPADRSRRIVYKVYDTGEDPIESDFRWSVVLGYFSGYEQPRDGGTTGILMSNYFTDGYDDDDHFGVVGPDGAPVSEFPGLEELIADSSEYPDGYKTNNLWFNVDLRGGESLSHQLEGFGADCDGRLCFAVQYILPESMNGTFYFKLMADAFRDVPETNLKDNGVILGDERGEPVTVVDGVIQGGAYYGLTARRNAD